MRTSAFNFVSLTLALAGLIIATDLTDDQSLCETRLLSP